MRRDIHTLESLFGERLRALNYKRIKGIARDIVRQFTGDVMNCQPELAQVGPPPL